MATRLEKMPSRPDYSVRLTIGGKVYEGVGFESVYFPDGVITYGYEYYARHREDNYGRIASVKREKGLTVNFWGTIVLKEPIDFGNDNEVSVEECDMDEDVPPYDVNGKEIHVGDTVIWKDPDPRGVGIASYEVDEVRTDMVRMSNRYGECEAPPEECAVVNITPRA